MASKNEKVCSSYYTGLNDEAKKRYAEKIKVIGDIDPYCRMESKGKSTASTIVEWINWSDVLYADIYNYLILTPGMTHEQLKAYKSLEGYNHFINGWVSGITVTVVPNTRPKLLLQLSIRRVFRYHP